eukprot:980788-Amphidinium_carterae.1
MNTLRVAEIGRKDEQSGINNLCVTCEDNFFSELAGVARAAEELQMLDVTLWTCSQPELHGHQALQLGYSHEAHMPTSPLLFALSKFTMRRNEF